MQLARSVKRLDAFHQLMQSGPQLVAVGGRDAARRMAKRQFSVSPTGPRGSLLAFLLVQGPHL